MICRKFKENFFLYLDNELPDRDIPLLEKHIVDCAACRKELRLQLEIKRAIAQGEHAQKIIKLSAVLLRNAESEMSAIKAALPEVTKNDELYKFFQQQIAKIIEYVQFYLQIDKKDKHAQRILTEAVKMADTLQPPLKFRNK